MNTVLSDFWSEGAPSPAPQRSAWDQIVVVGLILIGIVDGLASSDVGWPAINVPLMAVLPVILFWRRSHPLAVSAVVSATFGLLHAAMLIAGESSTIVNAGVICITVYSLARWASGRDVVIGLGFASTATVAAGSTGILRTADGAIALPIFISLFALVGLLLRFGSSRSAARVSEAKSLERTRIARELHDSVAHHVSAIAVQAQGAQEVISSDLEAATGALQVIEQQASQTLVEMRVILGVLRDDGLPNRAPQPNLRDIVRLANDATSGPAVEVTLAGQLDQLAPSVEAGLFRLTQEAITNARRHAQHASRITVHVEGLNDHVRLTITDDGRTSAPGKQGYGIVGMLERANLLGGDCQAGPSPAGGWTVQALLPLHGRGQ